MKGLIFTAFFEMVEKTFSPEMVENLIDASNLPNNGAYTEVGTYDHDEMIRLVVNLSKFTGISIEDLEVAYGKFLFNVLFQHYSKFVLNTGSYFAFLEQIDKHVHIEVLKLYPDAELPKFETNVLNDKTMTLKYQSNHPFAKLAEGLLFGSAEFFKEKIAITSEVLPPTKEKKFNTLLTISRQV